MGNRTSQLQIRVTPAEKAALKRLAETAGQTLSSYVLSRVLPPAERELVAIMRRLAEPEVEVGTALEELVQAVEEIPAADLAERLPAPDLDPMPPVIQNRIAALVESEANRRGVEAPEWTRRVAPLRRPFFHWSLTSLKPHQLRVTPVAFKRRNLFFDPATRGAPPSVPPSEAVSPPVNEESSRAGRPGPPQTRQTAPDEAAAHAPSREAALMAELARSLDERSIEVEFYFLGGALFFQALACRPRSARVADMFRPAHPVREAIHGLAASSGLSETWPLDCVRELLAPIAAGGTVGYLELPGVRVFEPLPEYALAMKCAAMRLGDDFEESEDVRYLLRAMNVTSADTALAIVGAYFAERQLARDTRARLEALLPS